ncbi:glycosyltransferase family 2 protein [Roseivirga sp.]|uniref:glycosyltransferase family 2 protein n=1 Tax=Roseivirga sp. TaxID=1964215 RepID=UPI003B8BB327
MSQRGIKISVVIPTYNRPEALSKCLQALERQTLDEDWEVLVVDDGGETDLEPIVLMFEHRLNVTLLKQENSGPASARNNGVQKARGKYIAFLDDDCEPEETWLQELLKHARPGVVVGGKTENKLHSNRYAEASQQLVSFLYEVWYDTTWFFFTSNNFLIHRQCFLDAGSFDESFTRAAGEDREFCTRLLNQGYKLNHAPKAIINHSHHLSLKSYWRQHFNYGKAAVRYRTKLFSYGVPLPKAKLGFYMAMLKYPMHLSEFRVSKRLTLSGIIAISQLATFLGYLAGRRSHD